MGPLRLRMRSWIVGWLALSGCSQAVRPVTAGCGAEQCGVSGSYGSPEVALFRRTGAGWQSASLPNNETLVEISESDATAVAVAAQNHLFVLAPGASATRRDGPTTTSWRRCIGRSRARDRSLRSRRGRRA